jgi:hypothetical protein
LPLRISCVFFASLLSFRFAHSAFTYNQPYPLFLHFLFNSLRPSRLPGWMPLKTFP